MRRPAVSARPGAGDRTTTTRPKPTVDIVNFFLIWASLAMAIAWPFQLFLFSYIVLGPLHYLTEINWLDKQNYFLRPKDSRWFVRGMVVMSLLMTAPVVISYTDAWPWAKTLHDAVYNSPNSPVFQTLKWSWALMLLAFVGSAAWLFTERWLLRGVVLVFCLLSSLLFYENPPLAIFFGVFMPTIVHVFVFTILFMLYGTLKARSSWGFTNILSMPLAVLVIVLWPVQVRHGLTQPVIDMTLASAFDRVNDYINDFIGNRSEGHLTPAVFKVQSFLAFAYTYHYLNWFSKTSVIKWHRVEKKKFFFSGVLWVVSIALYKVDYRVGFAAVAALSVLHVILEFPLNIVSVRGILGAMTAKPKPT